MTLWTLGPWVICNNQQLSIAACPVRRALCSGCPVWPFSPPDFPFHFIPLFHPTPLLNRFPCSRGNNNKQQRISLAIRTNMPRPWGSKGGGLNSNEKSYKRETNTAKPPTHTHAHADRTYIRTHTHVYPLRRTSTCTGGHCWFNGRPAAAQCTTMRLGGAKRGNCTGTGV